MSDECIKLKCQLEGYFSMPFDVRTSYVDGENRYVCSPSNEEQMYFDITAYVHNKIRLIIEVTPQRHGGYILNEMEHSGAEKQKRFFDYIHMLEDFGAKVKFQVNNSDIQSEETWPSHWRSLYLKIMKLPIPENEELTIISDWLRHSFDMMFSLLTIMDVDLDEVTKAVMQSEGTPQEVRSIRYERNPINRQLCLHKKGYCCAICGMNFYDMYGELGKNFIEVHHTTPVSEMGENFILDIDRDLVPLCSNCHSMVHRRKPPYTIDELKKLVEELNYGAANMVAESAPEYGKEQKRDLIVGVVKPDRTAPFKQADAKSYYFGKRFPANYNLKYIQYFAPYYEGGIRGYYDVVGIRTARKSDLVESEKKDDNDIRIVLDLGEYHHLCDNPVKIKLVHYNYACMSQEELQRKANGN